MGHRHLFSTTQLFDHDHDTSWNHSEQLYGSSIAAAADSGANHPGENVSVNGVHVTSNWNPSSGSNGHSPFTHNTEVQHHHLGASSQSHNPFVQTSGIGNFGLGLENCPQHAASSTYGNYAWQALPGALPGVEGSSCDLSIGNVRGPYKRKSTSIPVIHERGSTSRCYEAGSSSDMSMASGRWLEKSNADAYQTSWDCNINPDYSNSGLSTGGEGNPRNVRSRASLDFEANLVRTHLSGSPSLHSYPVGHPPDNHSWVSHFGQSSNGPAMEWSHPFSSLSTHNRRLVSEATIFSNEANQMIIGNHNDFDSSRTSIPQNMQGDSVLSVRGVRSSHSQRSTPAFRNLYNSFHAGHMSTSSEGLQFNPENCPSRHPRPFSIVGWRNMDRNGRTRISGDRFRPFPDEVGIRDRLTTEGLMILDRSGFSSSRSLVDQHRDMRLDVDNMSYEELLALEERIGNVSTGLSDELISKCLTELIYCSSDQVQEDGRCVICLEEYKNMDDVGTLKACGHDFHVNCIRKWLLMKNLCPICKATALPDHMKDK